jgi:hypothetical protein
MACCRRLAAIVSVVVVPCMFVAPGEAYGQTIDDTGQWLALFARGDLGHEGDGYWSDRLKWWFDGHARFFDDTDGFGQSIVRPGIGYALTESAAVWMGYGWIRSSPGSGPDFDEHRIWQQLTWSTEFAPYTLGLRSRLEQRIVETGSETGWRFRQLVSLRRPVPCVPPLSLVVWDEAFFHLNDTDWGAESGFDQNRLFLGFGYKCDPDSPSRVEIGYLNQYVNRSGRDDLSNHLLSMNFYWSP